MIPVYANKFFRLPVFLAKDNLVVNTSRNSVSSVQFHSHKLLESWTLQQPRSFSCPVVYIQHKNELVCVIDKNVVVVWNYEADNLDGAKEVKFQDTVFAIVPVENQQVVIFNSGSCLLLEAALSESEFVTQPHFKNEENLVWADASALESKIFVFLLTSYKDGHKLYSFLLNIHGQSEQLSEQVISRDSSSLQSWCIKSNDAQISFITIWSDGQVHGYSKYGKPSEHLLTVLTVTDKELLAVEALDSRQVVVVRYHPSRGCSYEIWDTKYATMKTNKSIDLVVSQNLQVRVLEGTLFIPSGQGIVAEPLNVTLPTLASLIGKSSNTGEMQNVIYSWTSDGRVYREYDEECNDTSDCKFSTITTNEVFKEFLSKLDGQVASTVLSYLTKVEFISEAKLVKLLRYLLRKNCSELSEKSEKRNPLSKNYNKETAKMFLALFLIPYDDIHLQLYLRKFLSFEETVAALDILCKLFKRKVYRSRYPDAHWIEYTRLVNWVSLLFYSHFEAFVLCTEKELSLVEDLLKEENKLLENGETEADLLIRCRRKKLKFERSASSQYCIGRVCM